MISVQNITRKFGTFTAVDNVSFELPGFATVKRSQRVTPGETITLNPVMGVETLSETITVTGESQRGARERFARSPFTSTRPASIDSAASVRVLKKRAAHNHLSRRTDIG